MTVGIVAGPTEEELENRLSRKLLTFCVASNKCGINVDLLKSSIQQRVNGVETTLDLLRAFDELDLDTKLEIINECCEDRQEEPERVTIPLLAPQQYDVFEMFDKDDYIDETHIRKLIKHSKNPLEKQMLQRQLSNSKFMCGKHRHSKKKRKR